MRVDEGWLFMVPILAVVGSIVGLLLAMVPRMVNLWWHRHTPVSRAVSACYVTAYVAIGLWVHHSMGVSYARERASYAQELADDTLCEFCMAPIDGRQGWILVWTVAGLVAYALAQRAKRWCPDCGVHLMRVENDKVSSG